MGNNLSLLQVSELVQQAHAIALRYDEVIGKAVKSLQQAMREAGIKKIVLPSPVHYVGDSGDFHSSYVAVAFDADSQLCLIDEEGEEIFAETASTEDLRSVLNGILESPDWKANR